MKKTETDAIRAKATAMYTLVKIRNDVAMRDHDSLEESSVSIKSRKCTSPTFRVSSCPTGEHEVG
jgi:hypothetical protein